MIGILGERLAAAAQQRSAAGLVRRLRLSDNAAPGRIQLDGRELIDFASNDYLGLARDPRVIAALRRGAQAEGVGARASHLLGGHRTVHAELEQALASWMGRERALLFSSGWAAAVGAIAGLLRKGDCCVQDKFNHACLLDAATLSGAKLLRYPHADLRGCATQLRAARRKTQAEDGILLVSDSVFSMDGDVADVAALQQAAQQSKAWTMIDEAHALGVIGPGGAGAAAGVPVDVVMATLGKAIGGSGAVIAGSAALIEHLVHQARSFVFSTAVSPALASAMQTAVGLARDENWRRERLQTLRLRLCKQLKQIGLEVSSTTPIVPIVLGSAGRATALASSLESMGIYAPAIRPPTVAPGTSRLRLSLSADHSEADIDRLCGALEQCLAQLGPPEIPLSQPPDLP